MNISWVAVASLGGLLITVLTLVFYGGALWHRIASHEIMDNERIEAIKARLVAVEAATATLPVIQGELRVISGLITRMGDDIKALSADLRSLQDGKRRSNS